MRKVSLKLLHQIYLRYINNNSFSDQTLIPQMYGLFIGNSCYMYLSFEWNI